MAVPPLLHPFARPAASVGSFTTIVRGEGAAIFDAAGRRYVDALASLWYCTVGHGRPELVEAATHQMAELAAFHTFDIFTNEPADRFSALVAEHAPMPGARVFLTSSGSEAVDTALKLSRLTARRRGEPDRHLVVTREGGYHGVTYGGTSVSGLPPNQEHFGPLLDGIERVGRHDLGALEAVFATRGDEVAAVVVEPVQGAGGVHPARPGYLGRVRELCDDHGALLVVDEVITGFGRLGAWFASELEGVAPDLVTFAKGCTSGYVPLGGVIVGPRVREVLEADPDLVLRHGFTYSGHPTACAVGLANAAVLEADRLFAEVPRIERRLGHGLRRLHADGLVAEVRGTGAIWAVDLPSDRDPQVVRAGMLARGVIARPIGAATIALCPPLVIDDADLDRCVDALEGALVDG